MNKRKVYIFVLSTIIILSIVSSLFLFGSKNKKSANNISDSENAEKQSNSYTESNSKDSEEKSDSDKKAENGQTTTLLIYMIGSDLESRSGAGTDDMEELAKSGIDLDKNNVVVFAGGSTKWHNDITSEEKINILELGESGFKSVNKMSSSSMGTAESLSEFLNYGYNNYPADSYALIMWDHGNGPNIGYGKDMIFDGDSLTLAEMKTALSTSPFGPSNKLSWVGFDACLMSTAELVCVWDDYANYLVASQEIEPSFGWNYGIFSSLGYGETSEFLGGLTSKYLSSCIEYYDSKGFSNKDITLSCIDLSYGNELETAVNNLFAKLSVDVPENYDSIVRKRVATRSLGRASTGSEYDIVDIYDMATQLKSLYPEETAALIAVLDKMIVNNETNAQFCSGLSLYYPFYNKHFYENGWSQAYKNIGVFASYRNFLQLYQGIWLSDSDLSEYEKSPVPKKVNDVNRNSGVEGTYMLPLSPEQNANFAEAKVYVLEQWPGDDMAYQSIITSANVVNENGVLYADINGKAIHIKDNYGNKDIPVTTIHDTVGNISRFSSRITAVTYLENSIGYDKIDVYDIQFALNNETEELSISGIFPYNPPTKANEIPAGKLPDGDLSIYDEYMIPRIEHAFPIRNENGLLLSMDQWVYMGGFHSGVLTKENGLNFVYEPMDANTYYVMFEITDTNGNKYCSEFLEVEAPAQENVSQITPDDIVINWKNGEEIEIYKKDNVTLSLKGEFNPRDPECTLIAKNDNDFPVVVEFESVTLNGFLFDSYVYISLPANSEDTTAVFNSFKIDEAVELGLLDEICHIEGSLQISKSNGAEYLASDQKIIVNCSDATSFKDLKQSILSVKTPTQFRGALGEEQILYEDDEKRIKLMMFGKLSLNAKCYVVFENLSDKPLNMACDGVSINGLTFGKGSGVAKTIPGKSFYLDEVFPYSSDWKVQERHIDSIETLSLRFSSVSISSPLFDTFDGGKWLPVVLNEAGKEVSETINGEVIYDYNGISITVTDFEFVDAIPTWHAFVKNDSEYDISLWLTSEQNKKSSSMDLSTREVGAHQGAWIDFKWDGEYTLPENGESLYPIFFKVHAMDYGRNKVLSPDGKPITLYIGEMKDDTTVVEVVSGEKVEVAKVRGMTIYIEKTVDSTGKEMYSLVAENPTDNDYQGNLKDIYINGDIALGSAVSFHVYPDKKHSNNRHSFDIDSLIKLGAIDNIDTISGNLTVVNSTINRTELEKTPVKFVFSGDGKIDLSAPQYKKNEISPYAEALADKQVVFESEKLRITLMHFGTYSLTEGSVYFCFENTSEDICEAYVKAISLNSITFSFGSPLTIKPGEKVFKEFKLYDSQLIENNINSIETIKIRFRLREKSTNGGLYGAYEDVTVDVNLKEHGTATPFSSNGTLIFDKEGVKIYLNKFGYIVGTPSITLEYTLLSVWYLTIVNDSDNNIDISKTCNTYETFLNINTELSSSVIASHERIDCVLTHANELENDVLPLRVVFEDWDGERIFTDDEFTVFPTDDTSYVDNTEKEDDHGTDEYFLRKIEVTPFMDAVAKEQVLYETNDYRLKLIFFGNSAQFEKNMLFCLENSSNFPEHFRIEHIAVNSIPIYEYIKLNAGAGKTVYAEDSLSETLLDEFGIKSIESLAVEVSRCDPSEKIVTIPLETHWVDVKLSEKGTAEEFIPGNNVIFDEIGVKIILDGFEFLQDGRPAWNVTIINDSDESINFLQRIPGSVGYVYEDPVSGDVVWLSPNHSLGPHRRTSGSFYYNSKKNIKDTLNLNLVIYDENQNELFRDDEIITFYINDGENVTKTKIAQ